MDIEMGLFTRIVMGAIMIVFIFFIWVNKKRLDSYDKFGLSAWIVVVYFLIFMLTTTIDGLRKDLNKKYIPSTYKRITDTLYKKQ